MLLPKPGPAAGLSDDELRSLERVGSVSSASLPAVGSSYVASSLSWRFVECLGELLGSLELYAAELDYKPLSSTQTASSNAVGPPTEPETFAPATKPLPPRLL